MLRDFRYTRADRQNARNESGLASDAFVLSVFPGSWVEAETPILEVVTAAFDRLGISQRKLIWLAGGDHELIQTRLAGREDALVLERCWEIDRLMAATDVAITKMNRMTIFELHELMIPTIGLSFDLNPIDDRAVGGLEGFVRLSAAGLDADHPKRGNPRFISRADHAPYAGFHCERTDVRAIFEPGA